MDRRDYEMFCSREAERRHAYDLARLNEYEEAMEDAQDRDLAEGKQKEAK